MKLTDLFLAQLDAEAKRTERTLDRVTDIPADWKPHERSMQFGYLAALVARIPSWIALVIDRDELDLKPKDGKSSMDQRPIHTSAELVAALHTSVEQARASLQKTTDEHLMTHWRMLVAGHVVNDEARYAVIRDTFMHLAHHRGQLTVYLRLNEAPVASIYGPSADDQTFA